MNAQHNKRNEEQNAADCGEQQLDVLLLSLDMRAKMSLRPNGRNGVAAR
jgi:hypothetical protein